jgi:phage FluMu gp28-like protein
MAYRTGSKEREAKSKGPDTSGAPLAASRSSSPIVPLTEYQRRWVQDRSRWKIGVFTRQGGKSFGTSLEAVDDCVAHPKSKWVFLSAGERQSKELMTTASLHSRAFGKAIRELEGELWCENDEKYKQLEILFPNDSRIIGLPANPYTARGHSAHILLDEFAFHKDSRQIWKALFPTVTRGYRIRMISTFMGKTNKFYELFFSSPTLQRFIGAEHEYVGERGGWSKHFVDIHQAIQMGLVLKDDEGNPSEPDDLRLALNDEDAWAEEFECIPNDEAHSFLSHDLISTVESAQVNAKPDWVELLMEAAKDLYARYKSSFTPVLPPAHIVSGVPFSGDIYVGFDVARRRDLSVIWVDEKIGDVLRTAAIIEMKQTPFFIQDLVLTSIFLHPRFRRACIDETGIGAQIAESALNHFGAHRIEPVTFTPANKEAMAGGLKQNFDDRKSLIPADPTIRRSLHSMKRIPTSTGHFRFDAERSEETGHADHFWAKALSTQAASGTSWKMEYRSSGTPRESAGLEDYSGLETGRASTDGY